MSNLDDNEENRLQRKPYTIIKPIYDSETN